MNIDKDAEYIIDFDGVFQYYATEGMDTSSVATDNFAEFFAGIAKKVDKLNPTIVQLVKGLAKKKIPIYILTGRTKSLLGEFTEDLLKKEGINVTKIFYFPEDKKSSEYYSWKEEVIINKLRQNVDKKLYIYDDDKKLLSGLKNKMKFPNLKLVYYKFFKNGDEELQEF